MRQQRDGLGRFKRFEESKSDDEVGEQQEKGEVRTRMPRPHCCRTFMLARIAEALPEVAEALVREAKKGSVHHLKLLVQISRLDKDEAPPARSKKREKNLEEILMEAWEKEAEEERRAGVVLEVFPDTSGE